jgi:hypothetical protein
MSRPVYILAHALASAVFMYFLQTLALHATTETAVALAVVFGLAAAGLAWHQSNR